VSDETRGNDESDRRETVSDPASDAGDVEAAWLGLPAKYQMERLLGAGGMGSVYLARDEDLDRPVAIKLLSERFSRDPALVARFQNEARAVAKLNHPCIVQVYEFGRAVGRHYFAMEYVDGSTFADELGRRGPFTEIETVAVAREAAAALAVAHAAGIVHRDVKPDNMMRTRSGAFKLVDLGLAKVVDEKLGATGTGVAVGTPYYISPEQIRGEHGIDARTDVYSLGATMYHFATARVPFEGSSAPDVMSRHLRDPLPDPRQFVPSLSEGFCRLLFKMTAKDRAQRHRDMHEVESDLAVVAQRAASGAAKSTHEDWKTADLTPIESALIQSVGPMAHLLIKKAAEACATREELIESLADQVPSPAARRKFVDACGGDPVRVTPVPAAKSRTPAPTPSPIDPAVLAKLTNLLADRIGPVAGVIVRRAAAKAQQPTTLVDELATHVPAGAARDSFVAAARAVVGERR
jgi:serine/threonine-protein kinase